MKEQPELRKVLETLRLYSKKLFCLTDTHPEYLDAVMGKVLGTADWKDYFDIVICSANKPHFWKTEQPFF